jgi:hypothetical protein
VLAAALLAACFLHAPRTAAREDQFLMPEQSAAKAKQVLAQAIEALGGSAYLGVRDATCTGHVAEFDVAVPGPTAGYVEVHDFRQLPDKVRTEYFGKSQHSVLQALVNMDAGGLEFTHGGIAITVYDGDHGWTYDRSGVNELPGDAVAVFHDQQSKNIDVLLRYRLKEPDTILRYGGSDIIDGRSADWVEFVDKDDRAIRVAFSRDTGLAVREVVETRDPRTRMKSSETFYFSNYHPSGGVQVPLQILYERNGKRVFQAFYDKCDYNTNLPAALFTKESLDQRWAQSPDKNKSKDKKDKGDRNEKRD